MCAFGRERTHRHDRPDGASIASARPREAPRTKLATGAVPGTSPRTLVALGREQHHRAETGPSRPARNRKGLGLGVGENRMKGRHDADFCAASSCGGQAARAGTLQRLLAL